MANDVKYKISIEGVDENISKLKQMKSLINDINSSGGIQRLNNSVNNNTGGNVNNGGGASKGAFGGTLTGDVLGSSVISSLMLRQYTGTAQGFNVLNTTCKKIYSLLEKKISLSSTAPAAGAPAAGAPAAGPGFTFGGNPEASSHTTDNLKKTKDKLMENYGVTMKKVVDEHGNTQNAMFWSTGKQIGKKIMQQLFHGVNIQIHDENNKATKSPMSEAFQYYKKSVINKFGKSGFGQYSYMGLNKDMPLHMAGEYFDPGTPIPMMPQNLAGLKMAQGPSKLKETDEFTKMRASFNKGLSAVKGFGEGLMKLVPEIAAVIAIFESLKFIIKLFQQGIEEASESYKTAASRGIGVGQSQQLTNAFGQLGMNVPDMTVVRTMLTGNTKRDTETILNAAQTGMLGKEGQQLVNMAGEFRQAMLDGEVAAKEMQTVSRANLVMKQQETQIGQQFKIMLSEFSAMLEPILKPIGDVILVLFKTLNAALDWLNRMMQRFGIESKGLGDFKPVWASSGGGGSMVSPTTSLEKLGFVINSPAQEVATNIQKIANNTDIMAKHAIKSQQVDKPSRHLGFLAAGFNQTLPNFA